MLVDNEVNGPTSPFKDFIEASDRVAEQPEIIQVDVQDARHANSPKLDQFGSVSRPSRCAS